MWIFQHHLSLYKAQICSTSQKDQQIDSLERQERLAHPRHRAIRSLLLGLILPPIVAWERPKSIQSAHFHKGYNITYYIIRPLNRRFQTHLPERQTKIYGRILAIHFCLLLPHLLLDFPACCHGPIPLQHDSAGNGFELKRETLLWFRKGIYWNGWGTAKIAIRETFLGLIYVNW